MPSTLSQPSPDGAGSGDGAFLAVTIAAAMGVALLIPQVSVAFDLIGSSISVALNLVLPVLFFRSAVLLRHTHALSPTMWHWHWAVRFVLVVGLLCGLIGTGVTIHGLA